MDTDWVGIAADLQELRSRSERVAGDVWFYQSTADYTAGAEKTWPMEENEPHRDFLSRSRPDLTWDLGCGA